MLDSNDRVDPSDFAQAGKPAGRGATAIPLIEDVGLRQLLVKTILPELERSGETGEIRVSCRASLPGHEAGREALAWALILAQVSAASGRRTDELSAENRFRIYAFARDRSEAVQAQAARWTSESLGPQMPLSWLNFLSFEEDAGGFRCRRELRQRIHFAVERNRSAHTAAEFDRQPPTGVPTHLRVHLFDGRGFGIDSASQELLAQEVSQRLCHGGYVVLRDGAQRSLLTDALGKRRSRWLMPVAMRPWADC